MRRSSSRAWVALFLLVCTHAGRCDEAPQLIGQPRGDYQARRKTLMAKLKEAAGRSEVPVVVLRGEDDRLKEDFEEGRFRQKNHFAYLTGVETPGAFLVLLPAQDRETLYLPPAGRGSPLGGDEPSSSLEKRAEALGFDHVESTDKLLGDLFAAIADPMRRRARPGERSAVVYTLTPNPKEGADDPQSKFVRFLHEGAPTTTFRDVAGLVNEMRKAKSPAELALLQKAIDITGAAQAEAIASLRPGKFEFQVEGKILGAFLDGGSLRPGFKSIVGSGPNSTIPHYFLSSRRMAEGDLLVVDIGAEYELYTADITRTYPVSGKFTPRQREIYQLVLDAQSEAAKRMIPGKTRLNEGTAFVSSYLSNSPLRAKDVDGKEYTMDHFFIHGLGHYLGMDVHDVGDGFKAMQAGEVFTIEPGIYIKPEALGVRIEDDYLMTDHGAEKLSKAIPSDPDEIERLLARARKN